MCVEGQVPTGSVVTGVMNDGLRIPNLSLSHDVYELFTHSQFINIVLQRKGSDAKEQDTSDKPRRNVSWQDKGWSLNLGETCFLINFI